MLRRSEILGLALLLAVAPLCFAQIAPPPQASLRTPAAVSATSAQKSKSRAKKSEPVAEVPQTPPPPPTLEQQPPTAPQVTYKNGQLSIDSRNATLSQVLRSVQAQTGASVDIPPGAGNERVVATLGPGQPKDVLASLLNGSKFNYVILGEANKPGSVQKVILMASAGASAGTSVATAAQNMPVQPQQQQAVEPPEEDYQQASEPEVENQNQLAPGPAMPGGENLTPDVINPAGRTPEQMLQELQRMQQQQQQMQQQLNPANQQQQQPQPPGLPLVSRPQPQ
jgi:hypothetical protein